MRYYYAWRNNEKRATLYKRHLRVIARGKMNSALVEFENGQREIISRSSLRKLPTSEREEKPDTIPVCGACGKTDCFFLACQKRRVI